MMLLKHLEVFFMKKQLYSIKDDLSFDFEPPFAAVTDVACLRMVSSQIQSEINSFNRGTVEYDPKPQHSTRSLYYVGSFDTDTGAILSDGPIFICKLCDAENTYQSLLAKL